ncbi:MAG: S-adenosylmethionine:tRNA ribosyltransferase-isomerase [Bacteroidales bacterium]|nr:S-adenosylmethionine:tRNA ribosyltransferase-isomerase [Bacteroidales bacterium]
MKPIVKISDYTYPLPQERIAKYPLEQRDSSKLLVYENGSFCDDSFFNLSSHIPENSFMVFNDTKVVPARLFFKKETGALIEILCLNPDFPSDYAQSFASKKSCIWSAVVGNAKKWKGGLVYFFSDSASKGLNFRAELVEKGEGKASKVRFLWDSDLTFSEVLEKCGKVPIPPYLNRDTEDIDKTRYQTIYAHYEGSVAAPTAGLHFTDRVLKSLDNKNIKRENICLHVGAGTFVPVKSEYISEHKMHSEPFSVTRGFLEDLLAAVADHRVVAVGTTSTRCLESLYYIGVHCIENPDSSLMPVTQWEPYEKDYPYSICEALQAIIGYMDRFNMGTLMAGTSIIIVPGFKYRVVDMLVTNFHQPQSTLLLLIGAFIGDGWKDLYAHALEGGYRFLSYGDSSLLFRK